MEQMGERYHVSATHRGNVQGCTFTDLALAEEFYRQCLRCTAYTNVKLDVCERDACEFDACPYFLKRKQAADAEFHKRTDCQQCIHEYHNPGIAFPKHVCDQHWKLWREKREEEFFQSSLPRRSAYFHEYLLFGDVTDTDVINYQGPVRPQDLDTGIAPHITRQIDLLISNVYTPSAGFCVVPWVDISYCFERVRAREFDQARFEYVKSTYEARGWIVTTETMIALENPNPVPRPYVVVKFVRK